MLEKNTSTGSKEHLTQTGPVLIRIRGNVISSVDGLDEHTRSLRNIDPKNMVNWIGTAFSGGMGHFGVGEDILLTLVQVLFFRIMFNKYRWFRL